MKVFSYYQSVPELNAHDELRLLTLWRRRWSALGFEPIILGEYQARQHSMFAEYDRAVSALPSCNPPGYERSCYLRWLALAQVGGGIMADYDLFPYDSGVEAYNLFVEAQSKRALTMFQERSPSLVHASQSVAVALCKLFTEGKYGNRPQDGKPHTSDQYILEDLAAAGIDWIERRNDVRNYSDEGWETALFTHWAHDPMKRAGKLPKWQHIPGLRK